MSYQLSTLSFTPLVTNIERGKCLRMPSSTSTLDLFSVVPLGPDQLAVGAIEPVLHYKIIFIYLVTSVCPLLVTGYLMASHVRYRNTVPLSSVARSVHS